MKRKILFVMAVCLFLSTIPLTSFANHCHEADACSEYLVKFSPQASPEKIGALLRRENLLAIDYFNHAQIYHLAGDPSQSMIRKLQRLNADDSVVYAEPNYIVHAESVPNDPRFSEQWGLNNIGQNSGLVGADTGMEEAWNTLTGSSQMIVAILDSGIDYRHEDLSRNIWVNSREIPGNHIDDDGDGFVDDYYGYNFYAENSDPMDTYYHGTHLAGIIGAVGNNGIGVTGINWNVKLMALKILDSTGAGSTSDIIRAIDYAIDHGAKIINASWVFSSNLTGLPTNPALEPNQTLRDAIAGADQAGLIFVAAAGNFGTNNDSKPFYPASYSLKNIISVSATTPTDALASFSNYGAVSVDLGAPGQSILSTYPSNLGAPYAYASGTSMASPHVAGAAALLWSANPTLTHRQVIEQILQGVQPDPALQGKTVTGGRLDVARSMALAPQTNHPPVANAGADQSKVVGQSITLVGSAMDPDGDVLSYEWTLLSPTGSSAVLNTKVGSQVTFVPDVAGTYRASLVASDGQSLSLPDTASIQVTTATTSTTPPTLSIRIKRNGISLSTNQINVGDLITLDGSGSHSSSGQPLTYQWAFIERPTGSVALMNNPTSALASFKPDRQGRFTVRLTVSDGKLSSSGEVALWASATTATTATTAPTISLRIKRNGVSLSSNQINIGDLITLDASGSMANGPSLSFLWSFALKPTGSAAVISNPSSAIASFRPDRAGQYIVNVTLSNGTYSSRGQVSLWANAISAAALTSAEELNPSLEKDSGEEEPRPNVGIEASQGGKVLELNLLRGTSVEVNETVTLDGGPSTTASNRDLTFHWSLVSQPEESQAIFPETDQITASLRPDVPGQYTVRLIVNDEGMESSADLTFLAETKIIQDPAEGAADLSEAGGCSLQDASQLHFRGGWLGGLGLSVFGLTFARIVPFRGRAFSNSFWRSIHMNSKSFLKART